MFKVMGEFEGVKKELDSSNSFVVAEFLAEDFSAEFGPRWAIWFENAYSRFEVA